MYSKTKNIIRTALIMLWVYASVSKLSDYRMFLSELNKQPFPKWSIPAIAIVILPVEMGTAILLAVQKTKIYGFKVSVILMSLFTVYVALALARVFGHIPCPCAGIIGRMPWLPHLVFNIFFTIISYAGYYLQKPKTTIIKLGIKKIIRG